MQYRQMQKNGDSLSILGYGCMRLPMRDGRIDEVRAIGQIRQAIDSGVNYVDTAWPYHGGESEPLLGRALQNGYRDRVKIATKLPSWMITSRADMDRYLAAQMKKLGTDQIEYYLLHSLNGASWDILHGLGVLAFLDQAKEDGRIVNAGFSFHGEAEDFKRIVDAYPWVCCQIQYNYLDQQYQAGKEGIKYASARGLGVIAMEPLRGGCLGRGIPPVIEAMWNEVRFRRTPVEWALRWIWNHPEVTVVLSGMNNEVHIEENISIADTAQAGALNDDELALVERVGRTYRELMKVGCTGCGYCMPCPAGVAISICFEEYNKMHLFGEIEQAKNRYAVRMSGVLTDGSPGFASLCVGCESCQDKCPQHIQIPDMLKKVVTEMEGPTLQSRITMARGIFKIEAK